MCIEGEEQHLQSGSKRLQKSVLNTMYYTGAWNHTYVKHLWGFNEQEHCLLKVEVLYKHPLEYICIWNFCEGKKEKAKFTEEHTYLIIT